MKNNLLSNKIMKSKMLKSTFFVLLVGLAFVSCRGEFSEKPPVHLNVNMDFQPKFKAQGFSHDYPEGTVAYGGSVDDENRPDYLKEDEAYYTGKKNNQYVDRIPMKVDMELIKRGQRQYNIYCAVCHDKVGTSKGIVIQRGVGFPPPPQLASDNVVNLSDGNLFEAISIGRRNMPGYQVQIDIRDRWAIVSYVRAIQASRRANIDAVPDNLRENLK